MGNAPNIELIVGLPTGTDVVQAHMAGDPGVARFLGPHFGSLSGFVEKTSEVDGRFDRAARERAAQALLVPSGADPARLDRFVEEGGYMVTTGQQPGLFGGPMYSIHKALTAVRLAEALEAALERPVLPVFWVASEDHDWAEANHVDVIGVDNALHRIELAATDPKVSPPIHRVAMGDTVEALVEEFVACLPGTDFSGEYVDLLRGAFTADSTIADGFHATLQHLLGRFGLFFTDAAHPSVKQASAGLLRNELGRAEELEHVLRVSSEALGASGYGTQVAVLDGGVNLFLEGPAGRERIYRDGDGFRLRTSGVALTLDEILARQAEDPAVLSPNVLLRPVVESEVFPTLAYVGGPGEIAYFAQLKAYFEAHGITMPVVYPRWTATPLEAKIRKVLDKFGLEVDALQRPFHEMAGEIARDDMPEEVRSSLGRLRGEIAKGVAQVQEATKTLDPTLKGPAQHVRSQAFAALDELERKVVQAVKREAEIKLSQLEKAQLHLYPNGKPTERVQSPFYFLARYGGSVLDALYDHFEVNLG